MLHVIVDPVEIAKFLGPNPALEQVYPNGTDDSSENSPSFSELRMLKTREIVTRLGMS